jgi:eukaryotic-like serine/threonine-protein kinase
VDDDGGLGPDRPTVPGMPVDPAVRPAPVVPGYVLEELLGRGGSGEVWRARPRAGGPPVAVKVLVRGDPDRQVREASLLAELDHPHLVRLHQVVRREVRGGATEVTLVLDLLAGGSLAGLLTRRGRLRPGEVVTTVAPVAAALAHAHDRGVVHGDLSPGNIVFTAEGRPVLTDLGTARLVGEARRAEVTPAYVDPVVARGGAPGPASDVFGVAAAAFHALTGIAPWNAADPAGTLAVAAQGEVPDLALLAPDAPAELVRVVTRGLSLEPHRRGSAAAFALDLRHACRPEPVRLPVPGIPDDALGHTDQGPRTELTHQVADRRPRAAHAAPVDPGRVAGLWSVLFRRRAEAAAERAPVGERLVPVLRRCLPPLTALLVVAGALVGAAWLGAGWGGTAAPLPEVETASTVPPTPDPGAPATPGPGAPAAPGPGAPAAGTTAGATSAPGTDPASPAPLPTPSPTPGAPAGDPPAAPPAQPVPASPTEPAPTPAAPGAAPGTEDLDGWAALLGQLYTRRSGAYATADPGWLSDVYTADSALLARDGAQLQALAVAGESVVGFAPTVRRVTGVSGDGSSVVVDLVDEVPGYRVVAREDPGGPGREVPGRPATAVRMTLSLTGQGWRIVEAARQG